MLTFNPETHQYKYGELIVPSVTQILSICHELEGTAQYFTVETAQRGQYVHRLCELSDNGKLAKESIDPDLAGYLVAWHRFKQDRRPLIKQNEVQVFNPSKWYAGTLDRIVFFEGDKEDTVLDIKTGDPGKAGMLQLAAYAKAAHTRPKQRLVVQLSQGGSYRLHWPKNSLEEDFGAFLACKILSQDKYYGGN